MFRQFVGYSATRVVGRKLRVLIAGLFSWFIQGVKSGGAYAGIGDSIGSGKHALVVANGPSKNNLNLERVRDWVNEGRLEIFLVNFGILDFPLDEVQVHYLVLSDPSTHPLSKDPRNIQLQRIIEEKSNIRLITPSSWHTKNCAQSKNNNKCLHFNDVTLEGVFSSTNPRLPRGYASLTGLKAIAVSRHLDFSKTLVIGLDNSFYKGLTVDSENRIIQRSIHYNGDYGKPEDLSHFYPNGLVDYFGELASIHLSIKKCFKNFDVLNLGTDSETDSFRKITRLDLESELVQFRGSQ